MPVAAMALDPPLFVDVLVTTLVIMDPLGNVPVFLSLTRGQDRPARQSAALQATLVAGSVILIFALVGQGILQLLGLSLPSVEVAGGLLLVLVALELLRPESTNRAVAAPGHNVALVPLGTPLLAGPGAIAATMVYVRSADGAGEVAAVISALLVVLTVVYLSLRYAARVAEILKPNGIELVSRVVGLLLAAIAVQLVATGIEEWVRNGVR